MPTLVPQMLGWITLVVSVVAVGALWRNVGVVWVYLIDGSKDSYDPSGIRTLVILVWPVLVLLSCIWALVRYVVVPPIVLAGGGIMMLFGYDGKRVAHALYRIHKIR